MFLSGVIEGFYGPPWTVAERAALFDTMSSRGLNTYLYCPKDDLHHRAAWREPYGAADAGALAAVVAACHARGVRFLYGIGPGLDIRYGEAGDRRVLRERCEQMLAIGVDGVALLFDDIPDGISPAVLRQWGSLAAAQADVANELFAALRPGRPDLLASFCPTPYCGRMAAAQLGGTGYLQTLGTSLDATVDVFWTGPEIVSAEIPVNHVRELAGTLRRQPIIWDNLHANDYDGRRMILGPYSGRALALRGEVRGILTNPNNEYPLNHMAVHTLATFLRAEGVEWAAREAYLDGLREWQPAFETVGGPVEFDALVRLADCYYLPHEEGPGAEALLVRARLALTDASPEWRAHATAFRDEALALRDFCTRLSTMRNRALFHALSRRLWDLREELDLLARVAEARLHDPAGGVRLRSDFHLPRTFRGGTVARLQRLLTQHEDGSFTPTARPGEA